MTTSKHIAYYRVSRKIQQVSGLGLEAQRQAVRTYLAGRGILVAEVVEVESGRKNDRPKLAEALRLCRLHKAGLVIAKLDRLARNVAFVSSLMDSDVEFTAVDFPQANRLTVHILAAVAEHEARACSERTRAALRVASEIRGVKLGGDRGNLAVDGIAGRAASLKARQDRAARRAADIAPIIAEIQASGATTLAAIAARLNSKGIPTAKGGTWAPVQVDRILKRAA